jgi:hypothetical protein
MTGTIRLGKGAFRKGDLKKADDEIADSTHRKRIRGLLSGVNRQTTAMPNSHPERWGVNPTSPREEDESYLRRSPFWSGTPDYRGSNATGQGRRSQQRP